MSERKPYPSDLSDEQWVLIEPAIAAWKAIARSAVNRAPMTPHDLPPKGVRRTGREYADGLRQQFRPGVRV